MSPSLRISWLLHALLSLPFVFFGDTGPNIRHKAILLGAVFRLFAWDLWLVFATLLINKETAN
jgi:hypothetical protein